LQRAIAKDVARVKGTALSDTPAMLVRLDELVSLADELPLGNAVQTPKGAPSLQRKTEESLTGWSGRMLELVREEVRGLVRVSKIENPDVALLSPEQSFFVRENFKLKILNARLGLLSRQTDAARADLVPRRPKSLCSSCKARCGPSKFPVWMRRSPRSPPLRQDADHALCFVADGLVRDGGGLCLVRWQ
jgi:hypothetical protein